MTVNLFPHILANVVDIQKEHLLLHTPMWNKTTRLTSARMLVRLYRLLLIHCIYVSVTKPTCPAFSVRLDTGSIRYLKVTGKSFMLCSMALPSKLWAALRTRPIQCWFNVWLQAIQKFGLVSFGGNSIRIDSDHGTGPRRKGSVNSRSTLYPIESWSCWPKTLLKILIWLITFCKLDNFFLTSQASKRY